ncbi:DUF4293 domain-containing protein [Flavobacteriaceae bacterium]|nr:DUF4293 domain-containing protein [Flavobacteriaceae bacterium]
MIQRIQSLYLFVAGLFYFLYWFFGLEWYERGYPIIIEFFSYIKWIDFILVIFSFIPLIISLLCLLTFLLFKSRRAQIKLSLINLRLSMIMCLFTAFYFYHSLTALIELMPSVFLEFLMYAAILNPFLCTYLIFNAIKSIRKDDDLVSSIDRIR